MHWTAAKRVLRYLKKTETYDITYIKSQQKMLAYVDSDCAGDVDDRKSCSGFCTFLAGRPISWSAKKQKSVARSTMEFVAEFVALSEVTKEVVYLRNLFTQIGLAKYVDFTQIGLAKYAQLYYDNQSAEIYCDNQSAIRLSKDIEFHRRSKHIDIRHSFSRETQENSDIIVNYIPTGENVADVLTKPLPRNKHKTCVRLMNMEV